MGINDSGYLDLLLATRAAFSPEQPPAAWVRQHDEQFTRHGILRFSAMEEANRPVPRQASCHYYSPDTERDIRNFYFY